MRSAKLRGMRRTDPHTFVFLALLVLGGVATVLLDSWTVFGALVLLSVARIWYGLAVRRQRRR